MSFTTFSPMWLIEYPPTDCPLLTHWFCFFMLRNGCAASDGLFQPIMSESRVHVIHGDFGRASVVLEPKGDR